MAVVSRIATAVITGATGSRSWVATAAVQDTAAGSSVVVTVTSSTTGAGPPIVEDTLDLNVRMDNVATNVRTFSLTPGSASQTAAFFFTADGTSSGALMAELLRLRVSAVKTTGLGTAQYNVTSDDGQFGSAANVYPATFGAGTMDAGYIRGTTTLVEDLSNTSLGGAPASPAAYDESLFVRLTSGAASGIARALSVSLSAGSLSGSTNSTTSATRDLTFANVVDDRFPAASTSTAVTVTVPNAALVAIPAWTYTSTTDDTLLVDPRLTGSSHFQTDDDVFGLAKADATNQMLGSQSGFLWTRFVNARGTGINGLTVTQSLDPSAPGATITSSTATALRDGQNGWTDKLDWTVSKPGGTWAKTVDVTAPADIDPDTYVLSGTGTYTLLAADPRIEPIVSVGPVAAIEARHLEPGDSMQASVICRNSTTRKRVALDTSPTAFITRKDRIAGWQYLATDGTTWVTWGTGAADLHTLTQETDTLSYAITFSSTGGWGATDLVAVDVVCLISGTPYQAKVARELVSGFNRHDAADAVPALNDLSDVDTTGVASGDVLYWDGATWRDEHMPTAAEVANAVWDETTAETRTAGSYGVLVRGSLPVPAVDPAAIVDATWNELTSEARTAGSYGALVRTNLDAAVSSVAPSNNVHADIE